MMEEEVKKIFRNSKIFKKVSCTDAVWPLLLMMTIMDDVKKLLRCFVGVYFAHG
jgi:hypothetical protein